MPRPRSSSNAGGRRRSSSGASLTEMTNQTTTTSPDPSAAQELLRLVKNLKTSPQGQSCWHALWSAQQSHQEPPALCLAERLLERAQWLDHSQSSSFEGSINTTTPGGNNKTSRTFHTRQDLILAPNDESGATPLHVALQTGHLAAVLLLLRDYPTQRLTHRPMQLLEDCTTAVAKARDNEGLTPLELLGRLQIKTLQECRMSLQQSHLLQPFSDPERQHGDADPEQDPDSDLALLAENLHLLEPLHNTNEEEDSSSTNITYGTEVLTFGRANHVALGTNTTLTQQDKRVHPQRVHPFSLSEIGRDNCATRVAAATHHTLVVTKGGHLYSCGWGKGGRLGLGRNTTNSVSFARVVGGGLGKKKVVHVAAAEEHSLCVTVEGHVYAFGSNRFGQLGVSPHTTTSGGGGEGRSSSGGVPRRVEGLPPCGQVAAGHRHSVVLTRGGHVYTFGDNAAGQLGRPLVGGRTCRSAPQRVEALVHKNPHPCKAVEASEQSTLVLVGGTVVNSIYAWGHGSHVPRKVSLGETSVEERTAESRVCSFSVNPVAIACAKHHNAAITDDGCVYTWGLHTEPLGTTLEGKRQPRMAPQLVTSMLPENGGGRAVAISACETHTAVVTDCGHLYTFGATPLKDVMGHEGQRWQPHPKRVPGVHRVVSVSSAKEHNVLLVGTAIPAVPSSRAEALTLQRQAAANVARHVDLFNVIPIVITAHRVECALLKDYCREFVRLNLDGVLTLGRKSEMNCYLQEQLVDGRGLQGMDARDLEAHPLIYDVCMLGQPQANKSAFFSAARTATSSWETSCHAWLKACEELLLQLPPSLLVKYGDRHAVRKLSVDRAAPHGRNRALSLHAPAEPEDENGSTTVTPAAGSTTLVGCSERCLMLTANMGLRTPEAILSKSDCLSKEIRGIKKRLGQIASLEKRGGSLTPEQMEKIQRKGLLEADLAVLEPAMEKVQRRMLDLNLRQTIESAEPSITAIPKATEVQVDAKDKLDKEPLDDLVGSGNEEDVIKSFRCNVCRINCPDDKSLALHRNGRKHRTRVQQAEEKEREQTAANIMEEKRKQMVIGGGTLKPPSREPKKTAWNSSTSVEPRYRLPPPPHPPSCDGPVSPNSTTTSGWAAPLGKSLSVISSPKLDFQSILHEEQEKAGNLKSPLLKKKSKSRGIPLTSPVSPPPLKSPPWASAPVARVSVSQAATFPIHTPNGDGKKNYSLADFMGSPSPPKTASKVVTAPWSSPPVAAKETSMSCSPSFLEIQQQEETFRSRQDQLYGAVEGKWFIERKERAGSISAIQEAEEKDREHQRLVEEQLKIEKQIERERQEAQQKKKKKSNARKKKRSESASSASHKKATAKKDAGKPKGGHKANAGKQQREGKSRGSSDAKTSGNK